MFYSADFYLDLFVILVFSISLENNVMKCSTRFVKMSEEHVTCRSKHVTLVTHRATLQKEGIGGQGKSSRQFAHSV